ncbi:Ltp family lipoprotein [Enterococcus cecorum]|uniref:Ltp family lipoprotein n=1 Tax=Enterococcus cecorum TaxID=44008 RepID=UPI003D77268D
MSINIISQGVVQMKKILSLGLVCSTALLLAACGSSDTTAKSDNATASSVKTEQTTVSSSKAEEKPAVPAEYTAALKKAESYSKTMHMSKQGIYDQLTSEFEKFPPEAAQYAVDNLKADYNANALAKAKSYQDKMAMSPDAIKDQLTSEFEKFTPEEAQYAVDNLNK